MNIGFFTILIVVIIVVLLGRYALLESQRLERHKKFLKDMENFKDSKKDDEYLNYWLKKNKK